MTLLTLTSLSVDFVQRKETTHAVRDLSLTVARGQTLGIVGESGSGKSVSSLALMGLLPGNARVQAQQMRFCPQEGDPIDLRTLSSQEMRRYRGNEIAMIFQEPMTSLNPVHACGEQVAEALRLHRGLSRAEARRETLAWFDRVELPRATELYRNYPHQLSGGQKQRVMIAMAMCCQPSLLIADEPTTALDVTVQRHILALIRTLQAEQQMAVMFISHDLGVIAEMADEVLVMRKGEMVEHGSVADMFERPSHAYTQGLLACRPTLQQRLLRLPTLEAFERGDQALPEAVTPAAFAARQAHLRAQAPLLRVQNLKTYFPQQTSLLGRPRSWVKAVDDVSFDLYPGETLGLVGESGSGKTTLGRSLLRLIEPTEGAIHYGGTDLRALGAGAMRRLRKEMQIIFQDPYSSLNPRLTIGQAIREPMEVHGLGGDAAGRAERVRELLTLVELDPDQHVDRYPHQFSGGQRQRVCIARALAVEPKFLVCDESVSALDVSVQATILNLLKDLQAEFALTYLFISHDLSVVRFMSDRILVMKDGHLIEQGDAESLYAAPQQAYTRRLIEAVPATTLAEAQQRRAGQPT
jgi:peptide/nickel transport system ATP-binding protein